ARAVLDANAYQTKDIVEAMNRDSGVELSALKVDGGMVHNEMLMQFVADILDVPVIRPVVSETTALGAAYAAGLAVGFWSNLGELKQNWSEEKRWLPGMEQKEREERYSGWQKAVQKTFGWVEEG
ncbi:MAG: glycerol kinase, partial [Deltaproteobacteria bacterium]|nr:glycerol kinase [Deltaproteobacteria bacterium]